MLLVGLGDPLQSDIGNPVAYDAQSRPAMLEHTPNGAAEPTNYSYLHNLQGDVMAIIDDAGNKVVEYGYDAWGRITHTGTLTDAYAPLAKLNPFRYRGYLYDDETQLYYLRSRYYNPEWGRFVNEDSLVGKTGKLFSHNMFAYCRNCPVMLNDTDGHDASYAGLSSPLLIRNLLEEFRAKYLSGISTRWLTKVEDVYARSSGGKTLFRTFKYRGMDPSSVRLVRAPKENSLEYNTDISSAVFELVGNLSSVSELIGGLVGLASCALSSGRIDPAPVAEKISDGLQYAEATLALVYGVNGPVPTHTHTEHSFVLQYDFAPGLSVTALYAFDVSDAGGCGHQMDGLDIRYYMGPYQSYPPAGTRWYHGG